MEPKTPEEIRAYLEEINSGYSLNGCLLFTGDWPNNPCFDLRTGKLAEGVTAGNFFDAEPISDEEASRLITMVPARID